MTVMNCITDEQIEQLRNGSLSKDGASLYQAFEKVKDGRKPKGKRYPLALILTLLFIGKMAGEKTIDGVIDWIKEREEEIKQILIWPKRFPTNKTYTYALSLCNHQEIAEAVAQVIIRARAEERCEGESSRLHIQVEQKEQNLIHTAVDGKILRGTQNHGREDQPRVHLLSFYECESGIVLGQFLVKKEKNEESACKEILHPTLVKERIITADSIFSSRAWCAAVDAYDGYYMITIKKNNPAVLRDLEDFFDNEGIDQREFHYWKEVNKGHGRLEVREIWASTQMNEWFQQEWAGIAQVYKIKRTIQKRGEESIEILYGITSVNRKKADAKRLLELNREHWYIENCLHYRRDVTLGEDASQVRMSGAPAALAALHGGILALMDFLGVKNVAKYMRHCCANPQEALQLLLYKLSRENG